MGGGEEAQSQRKKEKKAGGRNASHLSFGLSDCTLKLRAMDFWYKENNP